MPTGGEIASRLVLQGGRRCRRRQERQRLCVQSRRASMMVFDREGNFLRSWGEGQYPRAHGVHMAPDDTMFLTDDGGHFVRKVTLDGKVLLELGVPGKPAPYMFARRCADHLRGRLPAEDSYPAVSGSRAQKTL